MHMLSASKAEQFKIKAGKHSGRVKSLASFHTTRIEVSRDKPEGSS